MLNNPFEKKSTLQMPTQAKEPEKPLERTSEPEFKSTPPKVATGAISEELINKVKKSRKDRILEEHGGLESNIPINSPYWQLKRKS